MKPKQLTKIIYALILISPVLLGSRTFDTIDTILALAESREQVRGLFLRVDPSAVPSISPAVGFVSSGFGYRKHPVWGVTLFHAGVDICNKRGTPIRATGGGEVVFAGSSRRYARYGNVVVIRHSDRVTTLVAHLDAVYVREGDRVVRGEIVGRMGCTGVVTGPHCHYEVIVEGTHVDPEEWIL